MFRIGRYGTIVGLLALLALPGAVGSRALYDMSSPGNPGGVGAIAPANCIAEHNVGRIVLSVNNNGTLGTGFAAGTLTDCFTGAPVKSCEYPKGSSQNYLFAGSFWIGAVVGRDTLVSEGSDGWQQTREYFPDPAPFGNMIFRSIIDPTKPEYDGAISEQDYIATYSDTFPSLVPGNNPFQPVHKPLYISVTQRSFAWSYSYAQDFVLFDYQIKNVQNRALKNAYMGVYVDADVFGPSTNGTQGAQDDICGFKLDLPTPADFSSGCSFKDTVYIAWIADNSGKLDKPGDLCPNVTGTRIVRTPAQNPTVSFNWWIGNGNPALDYGPQSRAKFRDLGTGGQGTPEGDANKYAFLSNGEFDFDQIFTGSILPTDTHWVYPNPAVSQTLSKGYDTRYLLSFGPFDIDPGQVLPLSFAYVGGLNFHTFTKNVDNLTGNYNPSLYYDSLHFENFGINSQWASWIYDNPGVDTDGDGYFGKYRVCNLDSTIKSIDTIGAIIDTSWLYLQADTLWYQGDGVPDFKGASPPPAPVTWVYPTVEHSVGKIRVRWNGYRSETTPDVFSHKKDFEGYRVYMARDDRSSSYSMLASYDKEDYNKWVFNPKKIPTPDFELEETKISPYSLRQLQDWYGHGDTTWSPLQYSRTNPLVVHALPPGRDTVMYFAPQDFNASIFGVNTPIAKDPQYQDTLLYPRPPDSLLAIVPNNVPADYPDSLRQKYLTDDNYPKFFEYTYTIDNLLPTVLYYVNVTAFDFGSPKSGLPSLETSITIGSKVTYAMPIADSVVAKDLKVYVYPNPYRINGQYRALGYEGRGPNDLDRPDDRVRMINFANLPAKCTIKIFTLDGDLVSQIDHNVDPADPTASHETWNLITRNTQLVVSGIYYWTVEVPNGKTQIGKLVIIM